MKNREVYQKDPAIRKLINEGVATVNDERTSQALSVLRYELETFVCDGQYEKGMAHVLETFLKNIDQAYQPAVWVSGFYGSGKSHLVKMLRALWENTVFPDGATAQGIANLPQPIKDLLKELSTQGMRHGGLQAASGTLGSSASGSVRLALLSIIFKSVGLPDKYPVARFVMWLKSEGLLEAVKAFVGKEGYDWFEELDNFYVAEGLHKALVALKPNLFPSVESCVETFNNLYANVHDISSDDMVKAIRQAFTREGKFPLTLIVLDEVQQYISEDSQRSLDIQEAVETCSKSFEGKLLFVGTGQTAITGTSHLKKLEGRFTIRVELSDADVDAVIRQVILAKKPEARVPIEDVMEKNIGEISRHLSATTLAHRQSDVSFFSQDYPILPVRRRFWENALRVLDQTGTDSQLRNQLSLIFKAIQSNMDESIGSVVAGDFLFFDTADRLRQHRILSKEMYEKIATWQNGSADERLLARACALVFLIGRINRNNNEIGIRGTVDAVADLLLENLPHGSGELRSKLPSLLDNCDLLMKVGDEYRIRTKESAAWNDEFLSQRSTLMNEPHRIEAERDDRIRAKFGETIKKITLMQGTVKREFFSIFDAQLPADSKERLCVCVRDGWSTDENSVKADARQAGNQSPAVFVFVPKRSASDLRHSLVEFKAAAATITARGTPVGTEGTEAQAAMETIRRNAEDRISELLNDAFSGAHVFQAGGNEILGNDLQEMITEALNNSLLRLYSQFSVGNHPGWAKVYEKAQKGAPDALKAIGYDGEPAKNPVCKAILGFIAGGKKGIDIRKAFEGQGYGWPGDTVDGGLQVLLVSGLARAIDEQGRNIDPKDLERKALGKAFFKVESTTISTPQRIQIRKLLQKAGITAKQGEELLSVPTFLEKMAGLAENAGGEAPKPVKPNTAALDDIRKAGGNEQLLALYNRFDELSKYFDDWTNLKERIGERWPSWAVLRRLAAHLNTIQGGDVLSAQIQYIADQRLLLDEPDLIAPLLNNTTQLLRDELNRLKGAFDLSWQSGENRLKADANWAKLEPEQRHELRAEQNLTKGAIPEVAVDSADSVLKTLDQLSFPAFRDRIAAMPGRYGQLLLEAAKLLEPRIRKAEMPAATLRTEADVDAWVAEVVPLLKEQLKEGPVIV